MPVMGFAIVIQVLADVLVIKRLVINMAIGLLIKVVSGFYLGCVGMLVGNYPNSNFYKVSLICKLGNGEYFHDVVNIKSKQMQQISRKEYKKYSGE